MADDLSDVYAELRRLQERVRVLETANPLEASSITNGRLRIIGGTLRVDSGGSLIVVGTLSIDGTTSVTGQFTVSGPWNLSGAGTISGNVSITGNVTATGTLTQNGPWNLNGAGTIAGDTSLSGNFTVTAGGKITIGSMVLNPSTNGGSIKFSGGPEVYASGAQLSLYSGPTGGFIELGGTGSKVYGPGARFFEVNSSGYRFSTLNSGAPSTAKAVLIDPSTGQLYRAT